MTGWLHSLQSLGTVDGPGVRAVAFLSGCPLRCACCHNPDTWELHGGEEIQASALAERLSRFSRYFGRDGGVTLSGGEPLLQASFCREVFRILRGKGIHTALDTSGCLPIGQEIKDLLAVTDYVLLDLKYDTEQDYLRYVGCGIRHPFAFLSYLNDAGIPTCIRRVIIPSLNESCRSADALADLVAGYACVERVELLPMRKLCLTKYREMGIPFPLEDIPEPDAASVAMLQKRIDSRIHSIRSGRDLS